MSAPPRGPGRPSTAQHPTVTVANIDTGAMVTWNDGVFVGDRDLAATARTLAEGRVDLDVGPQWGTLPVNPDTPAGALAAMLAAAPGRTMLVAPVDRPVPGWPEPRTCDHLDGDLIVVTG